MRKRTLLQELKYFSLFNLGVFTTQDRIQQNRIRLINIVGVVFLFVLFFFTIYCIYKDYPRLVLINIVSILGTTIALYLNAREHYTVAKSALITICSLTILVYFIWQ